MGGGEEKVPKRKDNGVITFKIRRRLNV